MKLGLVNKEFSIHPFKYFLGYDVWRDLNENSFSHQKLLSFNKGFHEFEVTFYINDRDLMRKDIERFKLISGKQEPFEVLIRAWDIETNELIEKISYKNSYVNSISVNNGRLTVGFIQQLL